MIKNQSNQKHVLVVEFRIRPEFIAGFESAILDNAAASLKNEPGCHRFDVCRDPGDPALFLLYEVYESQEAIDGHLQAPHFLAFDASTRDWVERKTVSKMLLMDG